MKISLNQIAFLNQHLHAAGNPAPDGVDALVARIGERLGAVEEVTPFGERFADALVVRIAECNDHPDADRLHVCKIDDGGTAENVERDERGLVQVVCGAPNVHAGMLAVWLPPGATVPSTWYDPDPFVLDARPLRGVTSNGMLASARELTISDDHEGILEITQDSDEQPPTPGMRLAELGHLDGDVIIDIENKMFTHRPDCFGYLGIARELAGIQGQPYHSPDWYKPDADAPAMEADELPLEVRNDIPQLVPRFTAIAMRDVQVKPSPLWLQLDLARAGLRPINNIVDYSNYFMLLTGQPIHIYDYDKVRSLGGTDHAVLGVGHAAESALETLDGKEHVPRQEDIVITTGNAQAIGFAGVMGGTSTAVDDSTRNIIIEVATFDMYTIRRTAMFHGMFTDAVTRFTKGQSPLQNRAVLARVVEEIRRFAAGRVASQLIDNNHVPDDVHARASVHPPVKVSRTFIADRLGVDLSAPDMARLLTNVEFAVDQDGDNLNVTAPFWRTDIEIPEDVVEEVGRLHGFDKLPLTLPRRSIVPAPKNLHLAAKSRIRAELRKAGANELLTYSFVHGNLLQRVGQPVGRAYQLANALSPDLQYYRLSLTPSLLEKVHPNQKAGVQSFALFEMGKVHQVDIVDDDGLPRGLDRLALVVAAAEKDAAIAGAPYYQARKYLVQVLSLFGLNNRVTFEPLNADDADPSTAFYAPGRAATIMLDGLPLGRIGEYKADVRRSLKLPPFCAGFELGLGPLLAAAPAGSAYIARPRYPKVEQDICLKVAASMSYQQLFDFVWQQCVQHRPDNTFQQLSPVDIYMRPDDAAHKQITLRLSLASYERTLTDAEVNQLLDKVATAADEQFGAERV